MPIATQATMPDAPARAPRRALVDVHAHFVPDHYRAAAIAAGRAQPDGMAGLPAWSETSMIETMDRAGVAAAFLSISSPGVHFGDDAAARTLTREVNREGARLKAAYPDRLGLFASLPLPDVEGALREIAVAFDDLGVDGIVMQSNSGGLYPGNPAFEPVFAELDRRSAVVFLHPTSPACPCCSVGDPPLPRPILEFMFETTRAVTDLILRGTFDRYPNVRLIVPHGGATLPILADRIVLATAVMPGMTVTPASVMTTLKSFYYDLAGAPIPRQLPPLRTFADPGRLLYGSDWPFTPEAAVTRLRDTLEAALAGEADLLDAVRHGNATKLFPRLSRMLSQDVTP